ncbi:hypothetical protein [Eleftheria terrae]|uniref:hypothetical protein n=1 Tax=Eleftheria terrae TaxID=1597781 RepID=UPI00263AFC9F|nr:hypothetical protein [Eleftheria terrae]WKB53160.1 hypothetical protein N7L95_01780 [Eleftheria terrae]
MIQRFLAAALLLAAGFAHGASYEGAIDVRFPDELAGFTLTEAERLPRKELGSHLAYQGPRAGGVVASVYVYNAGLSDIPDGTHSPVLRQHFEQVLADVQQWRAKGIARSVSIVGPAMLRTGYMGCGPQFLAATLNIELPDETLASHVYLTVVRQQFVKLRLSYPKHREQGEHDAREFVRQLRPLLGHCL